MTDEGQAVTAVMGAEGREVLRHALRFPRGRYEARRAAQLSGIPERTVYDWAQEGILVSDFYRADPMRWSYRDLVYLRLLARFRAHGMPRDKAAERVRLVRGLASNDGRLDEVRITDRGLLLPGETHDRLTGEAVLGDLAELTTRFDLLAPIAGVDTEHLWGPNLVKPSDHTFISPAVLGGEPCLDGTRIPTASVHALVEGRGMSNAQVVVLYPQLTEEGVEDAVDIERRMRERKPAA
ncbi:MAG TPA: DUF433 domain-containing protein [Coriobacteriia bacterium]|nr:DUF433 domain-containing protein [Coriobacteriia bacterium]